jgi:outer membrane protein assembly factor BamB
VNAKTGAYLWDHGTYYSETPSPAIADGVVYVGDNGGYLYAFSLK